MGKDNYRLDTLIRNVKANLFLSTAIAITLIAVLTSMILGLNDLVPRLGAVLTMFGVLWEFGVVDKIRQQREQSVIHFTLVEASKRSEQLARYHSGKESSTPHHITKDFGASIKAHATSYSKEMALVPMFGAVVVILGTFLWAFGDWVTCSAHALMWSNCSDIEGLLKNG